MSTRLMPCIAATKQPGQSSIRESSTRSTLCALAMQHFLQESSVAGNETCLEAGRAVPARHTLQGPHTLYPMAQNGSSSHSGHGADLEKSRGTSEREKPSYDIFGPGAPPSPLLHKLAAFGHSAVMIFSVLMLDAFTTLVCWAPGAVALTAAVVSIHNESTWAAGWRVAFYTSAALIAALAGLCCMVAWMNANTLLWRAHGLWEQPSVSSQNHRLRMLGECRWWSRSLFLRDGAHPHQFCHHVLPCTLVCALQNGF